MTNYITPDMSRLIIIMLSVVVASLSAVTGGNPSSSLIIRPNGGESVIFVKPSQMKRSGPSAALTDMLYDITFTAADDSVCVRSTHWLVTPAGIDSVRITSGGQVRRFAVEKIYVEPDGGKKWKTRLSFGMSWPEFRELISAGDAPSLDFVGSGTELLYQDKPKAWNKRKEIYKLMSEIIEYNNE